MSFVSDDGIYSCRVNQSRSRFRGSNHKMGAQAPIYVPPRVSKETFTNPDGLVIKPMRQDVWKVDRPFVYLVIDVGSCMTVIKLKGTLTFLLSVKFSSFRGAVPASCGSTIRDGLR